MKYKIVELTCGLGNQMFQVAFAKSLQIHLQMPILLDRTWLDTEGVKHSIPFGLNLFKIDLPYANKEQIDYVKQKQALFDKQPKIIRSLLKRMRFPRMVAQPSYDTYIAKYLKSNHFLYFSGFFQNPKYFADIAPQIKAIIPPPPH